MPKTTDTTKSKSQREAQTRNKTQNKTKNQTQKRTNAASTRGRQASTPQRDASSYHRNSEIWGIACMALAIVFLIALILSGKSPEEAGFAGAVGGFFVKTAVAIAGKGKLLFPVVLFLWGLLIFRGKQYAWLGKRSLGLLLIFLTILGFCNGVIPFDKDFSAFITNSMTPKVIEGTVTEANPAGLTAIAGGGYLGAVVSYVFRWAFGNLGAMVILLALTVIGLLLLTGGSLSELFAAFSLKAKETAAEIKRAEAEEERRRDAERARQMELKKQLLMEEANHPGKGSQEWANLDKRMTFQPPVSQPISKHTDRAPVITEPKEEPVEVKVPVENAFAREFLPKLSDIKGETPIASESEPSVDSVLAEAPIVIDSLNPEPILTVQQVDDNTVVSEPINETEEIVMISAAEKTENHAVEQEKTENPVKHTSEGVASESAESIGTTEPSGENMRQSEANTGDGGAERPYVLPSPELLTAGINTKSPRMNAIITENIGKLEQTLKNFGISAKVTQVVAGPAVVRYELQPAPGVKVSKIVNLSDDIALGLAATQVRIEAPVPGKSVVGIEVPKGEITTVYFRDVIESENFQKAKSKISVGFGKDISGDCLVGDLAKMPHLMIAGATGSGKSVCINTLICSILYKATPKEVKFLLVDPKKVELSQYAGLPHLIAPVVTDPKKAAAALKWVVNEMENRYSLFAGNMVKDFERYNELHPEAPLPQIVVLIDELADLMMVAARDVEDAICRLAQMARAAGIHLVIATQRPSVDVITGLIKANIPSRIAFAVSSQIDSRTILDMAGAERLLGKGDMLYYPAGMAKPLRVQGAIIFEDDIQNLVAYCKNQCKPEYLDPVVDVTSHAIEEKVEDTDPLFMEAVRLVLTAGQASTSFLQRRMRIGNPRAGRLIDIMEQNGIVGPSEGAKARNILMTLEDFEERFGSTQAAE